MSRPGFAGTLAAAARAARLRAQTAFYRSRAYELALSEPLPQRLAFEPEPPDPRDLAQAQAVLQGRFPLPHGTIDARGRDPIAAAAAAEPEARDDFHRFVWLAPLIADGGPAGLELARALIDDWLDRNDRFDAASWAPHVLGPRCVAWAAQFRALSGPAGLVFRSRLLRALTRQARHLDRSVGDAPEGLAACEAAAALAEISAALGRPRPRIAAALVALDEAMAAFLLPDGGVVTRNGPDQLRAVQLMDRARRAAQAAGLDLPARLAAARARAASLFPVFCHPDGRFAAFHGAGEGREDQIAPLLAEADGRAPLHAPSLGFIRLERAGTCAILDAGGPPGGAAAALAASSPLALEFSAAGSRIVVNCGAQAQRGAVWREAARRTAAHSTIAAEGRDSGEFLEGGEARRFGARLIGPPVTGTVAEADGAQWAEGSSRLASILPGFEHTRRLWLGPDGASLRGEDIVSRTEARVTEDGPLALVLRFHLHPDQRASLAQSGDGALLAGPAGDGWRFRAGIGATGAALTLEPSIYLGEEAARRTEALTVRVALVGTELRLRWAFTREARARR
jgi:uncharacterized heparinase superfamily protein